MAKGMFVDTTICTGCKACQVACKEWNGLSPEPSHFAKKEGYPYPVAVNFTGNSYDNTGRLSARDWRHVLFIERFAAEASVESRWLFMSDSCKHCADAACLNVCPVGAIERTDLGNVVVRQDKCQGRRLCNKACPYQVISFSTLTGTSHKCTLCNDRIHEGMGTACAKACPTGSIRFGDLPELKAAADKRLAQLRSLGDRKANIYGYSQAGGLAVFYLLREEPEAYGLPEKPVVPHLRGFARLKIRAPFLVAGVAALSAFLGRERKGGEEESPEEPVPPHEG